MDSIFYIVLSYLIGAFPSGLIIGKLFYNLDLRLLGSCNIGSTNAYRILGLRAAVAVFAFDFLKGALCVWLGSADPLLMVLCGFSAIIGHSWSIYLKFAGGRGVATGLGVFAMLSPWSALLATLVWLLVLKFSRIVSLASILAAPTIPFVIWWQDEPFEWLVFALLAVVVVILKHKENIIRLWHGEEKKIFV